MKLVQMEMPGDCGPACLAMVLGVSLGDVTPDFPDRRRRGVIDQEMVDYLGSRGVVAIRSMDWPDDRMPAILTVPSLNFPGLLHYTVWDGARLLDPSRGPKRYPDGLDPTGVRPPTCGAFWATAILLWPRRDIP